MKKLLDIFSWLWLKNPRSFLPFMLRLLIPHGPKFFWYILDLVPRLAFTSSPPMNFSVFGTELIIELRMPMNYVCSNSSTGWYIEATNNVVLPLTLFSYWFIHGYLSFTPMNLPTNGESIGVVIGGFDPAALHASTAVGDSIISTTPQILPLDLMALSSWLCWRTTCPQTSLLLDPTLHVSWMQ